MITPRFITPLSHEKYNEVLERELQAAYEEIDRLQRQLQQVSVVRDALNHYKATNRNLLESLKKAQKAQKVPEFFDL